MSIDRRGSQPSSTELSPADRSRSGDDWRERDRRVRLKIVGLVGVLIFVVLIPDIFFSVHSGEVAVVWYRFAGGTDVEDVRGEGLRIKWPWDLKYIYDIRLRQVTDNIPALSSDGMPISVEISVRFRLYEESVGELHKHVGPDYVERLLLPELGSEVREQISQYRPADFYAVRRQRIQDEILADLDRGLFLDYEPGGPEQRAIHVEDVLIRKIQLPPKVAAAIEDKLSQEQKMLEYDFVLAKARKEAQRKEIEAGGIRRFQEIVNNGISERYLKWKGIDATLELARSHNAKIVVIGASEDGLPIILGGLDNLPAETPTPIAAGAALPGQPLPPLPPATAPPPAAELTDTPPPGVSVAPPPPPGAPATPPPPPPPGSGP